MDDTESVITTTTTAAIVVISVVTSLLLLLMLVVAAVVVSIILSPYERAPIWKRNNYGLTFGAMAGVSTFFMWKNIFNNNTTITTSSTATRAAGAGRRIFSGTSNSAPVTTIPAIIPATIMFAVASRVIQNTIMISSCYDDVLKQNTNLGHMCRTFLGQIRGSTVGGEAPSALDDDAIVPPPPITLPATPCRPTMNRSGDAAASSTPMPLNPIQQRLLVNQRLTVDEDDHQRGVDQGEERRRRRDADVKSSANNFYDTNVWGEPYNPPSPPSDERQHHLHQTWDDIRASII
ncbi:hypothetical protein FOZ62_010377 [Perkinsus olseni]|uniref:Uncharacterized protein n=1 Tax=Perkinsus olseni TaxID=32597 RepID=A0A7J6SAX3_PEROL|nr:hypothetical protein FOZ62_010377 [Perkinsus olseni]